MNRSGLRWAAGAVGLAAAIAIAAFYRADEITRGDAAPSTGAGVGVPARIEAAGNVPDPGAEAARDDTVAPDGLHTDAKGRLRVTRQTRDLFEYFLASAPRANRERQIALLTAHINKTLGAAAPVARNEALDLARRFVSYMDAHDAMLRTYGFARNANLADTAELPRIAEFLRKRSDLRRQHLGANVARLWYGDEEDREQQLLARLRSGQGAPEPAPVPRAQALTQQLQDLRAKGASPEALREFLRANVGEDAVQRFDAQRRADAAWAAKYASYRADVAAVASHGGLDADEVRRQSDAIRTRHFPDARDAARAAMLDGQPPPAPRAP